MKQMGEAFCHNTKSMRERNTLVADPIHYYVLWKLFDTKT